MDDKLLEPILDAAKAMGIGRSTAYRIINCGEVETVHIGKRHLVVVESRRKYVEKLRSMRRDAR